MEFVKVYEFGEYIGTVKGDAETIANLLASASPHNEFSINGGVRGLPIISTIGTAVQSYNTDEFDHEWFNEVFFPLYNKKLSGESKIQKVEFIQKVQKIPYMEEDVEPVSEEYPVGKHLFIYNNDVYVGSIENTVENITNYIANLEQRHRVRITDSQDRLILTTIGNLLDRVPNQPWVVSEIQPVLNQKLQNPDKIEEVLVIKD